MRRSNTGLILRHLRDHGGRSRATLATETGLAKSTMTTLISDLVAWGLVREGEPERGGAPGRPGMVVTLDGRGVCGVGVEINVDYLCLVAVDLAGTVIRESTTPIDAAGMPAAQTIARVGEVLVEALASLGSSGTRTLGVTIAAPGFTDKETGVVRLAPNLGWRDVALADEVARLLGDDGPPVRAENDAKLGAVAEQAQLAGSGVDDLLYITGDVGVGGGIITGGRLLRGADGFAGEIGHMPLDPAMRQCACGRRGCWETMVGLAPFLRLAADEDDPVRRADRPLEERLRELRRRSDDGDERTRGALAQIAGGLGTGVSILADVLNPRRIVLGGYFAWFPDELVAPVADLVLARRLNAEAQVPAVVGSRLGLTSAARGGAHHSLEAVFSDPTLVAR
jgi:predicted NBD/HSP70 family sugar kinase